jgi:hypothetical protein
MGIFILMMYGASAVLALLLLSAGYRKAVRISLHAGHTRFALILIGVYLFAMPFVLV